MSTAKQIIDALNLSNLIQTKKVLYVNPTTETKERTHAKEKIDVFQYNLAESKFAKNLPLEKVHAIKTNNFKTWINIDNINKYSVEELATVFKIHPLIQEDILSAQQRPKVDEMDHQIYCVMQMMYLDPIDHSIDSEQISFVLGHDTLLTLQEDDRRDHFVKVREHLAINGSKIRINTMDYLFYCLLDAIVDSYYDVMEQLSIKIEQLEEQASRGKTQENTMAKINSLRKEIILYRRNVVPVRDLLSALIRSENKLINPATIKYFNDVQDHVIQAIDLSDNYRDVISNIRDLHYNHLNIRTNESMKFMAVVTSLLAPATVIGGIFGMNFDKIPYIHNQNGFFFAVTLMVITPIIMLWWFKRKGWY